MKVKRFKTKPFAHQLKVLNASMDKEYFALLMEQGTGKSKVIVDTCAHLFRQDEIDLVLVIAPKGVAPAWLYQQFPDHTPEDVDYVCAQWKPKSRQTKAGARNLRDVLALDASTLRVIIMNVESFGMTDDAIDFAMEVLETAHIGAMCVIDESHRIKDPSAHSSKRILKHLPKRTKFRRILTGTVADKPFDLFSQFSFLSPSILQATSFTAFKSEYAEMMPLTHGLMRHIIARVPKKWSGNYIEEKWDGRYKDERGKPTHLRLDADGVPHRKLVEETVTERRIGADGKPNKKEMVPAYTPQVVDKNEDGTPKYKNLERLNTLIKPHSYRVLKRDCLDLPEKLFNRYYTELSDRQQALYNEVREEHRIEWEDGRLSIYQKLTVYLRLQQIICGYVPSGDDEGTMHEIFKSWSDNPRIESTLEMLADRPVNERAIIWCRFIPDILRLTEALKESYGANSVVQFYGATKDKDRLLGVQRFEGQYIRTDRSGKILGLEEVPEKDRPRYIISQQRAGGLGQTWIAAGLSFHYSNTFSLIDRLQAEDRPHRIGQKKTVNYIDMECEDTIDTIIINSMRAKKNVADIINGDERTAWI